MGGEAGLCAEGLPTMGGEAGLCAEGLHTLGGETCTMRRGATHPREGGMYYGQRGGYTP